MSASFDRSESQPHRAKLPAGRRQLILQLLRSRGSVSVADLEEEFGISAMTGRRDLRILEEQGVARRTYGGAVLPTAAAVQGSFEQRIAIAVEEKERLARATVELVADGETIFVDSSTSAYVAVRALVEAKRDLVIITNSLPVMQLLADASGPKLVGLGGTYQPVSRGLVGPETIHMIHSLLADRALFSVKGVTKDGIMSEPDPFEAEVKRAMIAQASAPIVLIDRTKLQERGLAAIARLDEVDLVLAAGVSDTEAAELEKLAKEVRRV